MYLKSILQWITIHLLFTIILLCSRELNRFVISLFSFFTPQQTCWHEHRHPLFSNKCHQSLAESLTDELFNHLLGEQSQTGHTRVNRTTNAIPSIAGQRLDLDTTCLSSTLQKLNLIYFPKHPKKTEKAHSWDWTFKNKFLQKWTILSNVSPKKN